MNSINSYIEQTNLKPTIRGKDVDRLVAEAVDHNFIGVCVPPFWVKRASREIANEDVQLVTVVGFPLGYQMTETKLDEIKMAIANGAKELDVVMNISAFKDGMPWTKIELAKCSKLIHNHECMLKVIIETSYLSNREIELAAFMVRDVGADFIKTSTGFASAGASAEDVKLLRSLLPSSVGIKAAGGIRTHEQAINMIDAGADRIGTSQGLEIIGVSD